MGDWIALICLLSAQIALALLVTWAIMHSDKSCTFGLLGGPCPLHRLAWWLDAQRWPKSPAPREEP